MKKEIYIIAMQYNEKKEEKKNCPQNTLVEQICTKQNSKNNYTSEQF